MTDLTTHLIEQFHASGEEKEKLVIALGEHVEVGQLGVSKVICEHFLAFAHSYLRGNPVVGLVSMQIGLGVRLQDGTEVFIMPPPLEQLDIPDSIPITQPKSLPGQRGITDTRSVPVFGGGK